MSGSFHAVAYLRTFRCQFQIEVEMQTVLKLNAKLFA